MSDLALEATITTQREVSANLMVRSLKEILGPHYGLLDKAKPITVAETGYSNYFNPDAPNRKYYRNETILAREDISKGLEIVAEFEKEKEIELSATGQIPKRNIKYLPLKHLCLVKKDGSDEAIDLVPAWQAKEANFGSPIGLLLQNNGEEAIMGKGAILFKDEMSEKNWNILNARGSSETGENLPAKFAAALAGAKATQRFEDIPQDSVRLMLQYLTGKMPSGLRASLRAALATDKDYKYVTSRPLGIATVNRQVETEGKQTLARLERNALASNLYFVRQVRNLGFNLLPELTNDQLVDLTNKIWEYQKSQYDLPSRRS